MAQKMRSGDPAVTRHEDARTSRTEIESEVNIQMCARAHVTSKSLMRTINGNLGRRVGAVLTTCMDRSTLIEVYFFPTWNKCFHYTFVKVGTF